MRSSRVAHKSILMMANDKLDFCKQVEVANNDNPFESPYKDIGFLDEPKQITLKLNNSNSSITSPQVENFDETEIIDESEAKENFRDSIKRMKRDTVTKKPCDFGNIVIS